MVLKTNWGSPTVTFKRQPSKDVKCVCSNVLVKYKKREISAVRDFPNGCGHHGNIVDKLNDPVQAEMPGQMRDSGFEEPSTAASMKQIGAYMSMVLDTKGLFSFSNIVNYKASALTKKAVADISVRVYPPRTKISAIRCFPKGCGRKATQAHKDIAWEALACIVNGLEFNVSCTEDQSSEETVKTNSLRKKAAVGVLPRLYPPRRRISTTRCFPEGCGRHPPLSSNEYAQEAIARKT